MLLKKDKNDNINKNKFTSLFLDIFFKGKKDYTVCEKQKIKGKKKYEREKKTTNWKKKEMKE